MQTSVDDDLAPHPERRVRVAHEIVFANGHIFGELDLACLAGHEEIGTDELASILQDHRRACGKALVGKIHVVRRTINHDEADHVATLDDDLVRLELVALRRAAHFDFDDLAGKRLRRLRVMLAFPESPQPARKEVARPAMMVSGRRYFIFMAISSLHGGWSSLTFIKVV